MANILLRSPYFVTVTTGGHLSAQMALTIDGTLRYTILKNATSNRTVFEIATLAKDYYTATYGGTTGGTIDTVAISYVITTYTAVDGGGTATAQGAVTHTGYYGYSEFWSGVNQDFDPDDFELTNTGNSQIIYLPDNTAGFAWDMNGGTATKATISTSATSVAATSGNYTWTIQRVCSAKYTPIKMRFINKNGIPQDQYFFLKSVESIGTRADAFKRNIFVQSSSSYDQKTHQSLVFNKTGRKRFTLNTDYLAEAYNAVIEDIMLSEFVWIFVDSVLHPVTVITSSLTKKTSLNDKLIQYTLEVEDANDIINNIV
jgi:predicted secreted protein